MNQQSQPAKKNLGIQKWVAGISIVLLAVKFIAWYITGSVAVLTDALESIINVIAGFVGLYSLYVAAKPRDKDHPYGHGKAEFISAAIEGGMILFAGVVIIYTAIYQLIKPVPIREIDAGLLLIAATAAVNFVMGLISVRHGRKNNSLALVASGRHLQSDSYTSFGIMAALFLILLTGYVWIDGVVAIILGTVLIITGYRILRRSIAGIMDEADIKLLTRMVELLNANRRENWIDLHNLRVIKYGAGLHIDCHLTVPWYLNVNEAHTEVDELSKLIRETFGESLELFVHSDGCLYSQCPICVKQDCPVRQHALEARVIWTLDIILRNKKHEADLIREPGSV